MNGRTPKSATTAKNLFPEPAQIDVDALSGKSVKPITKVVVGSRLHGLETPNSDWDYRGVHISPIKHILSPFRDVKTTTWIEGDEDSTSYELSKFCQSATRGNATILEVFFSDQIIEDSSIAQKMRDNWQKFMDTNNFVMASRGYAANQLNKMALFDDIGVKGQLRTAKFVVAYCRVLWQCAEFLKTGEFPCQVGSDIRPFLLDVKYNWSKEMVPLATEKFAMLQADVSQAWAKAPKMKPDINWIEEFIYEAYTTS